MKNKKTFRYIRYTFQDCLKAFSMIMGLMLALGLLASLVEIVSPMILADILELAADIGNMTAVSEKIVPLIALFCITMLVGPLCNSVFHWAYLMTSVRTKRYFGRKMFHFSKQIQLEALEDTTMLDRFKKAEKSIQNSSFMDMFASVVECMEIIMVCVGVMIVVGSYSPWLIVIALAGAVPNLLLQVQTQKISARIRRRQSLSKRRLQYLWELFTRRDAVKEMRTMGFAEYLKEQWTKENGKVVQELQEVELANRKKITIGICIQNVFYAANIAMSLYLMVEGDISVGEFAACLMAFASFHSELSHFAFSIAETVRCYELVEDYYDYFTIPTEPDGSREYNRFQDWIFADDVTFRYAGAKEDALRGVTCTIYKGEHVVIVGENGSGKTTLSKLLAGAYMPRTGKIFYDGRKTADLERKSLYRHISVVSQDFMHYNFSLRENVGISDISRIQDSAAMEELLTDVAGQEFMEKLGDLDVQLGREFGGKELSGGEWQKVAIARGLWKDSDIVILDEPTSALDPLMEYDILSKFVEMIRGKTSIIISHRVGVCRTADKIIVMKDGRVVECGKHEELLQKNGEYSRIWQEQAKWYA